jgi:hypothetical protein
MSGAKDNSKISEKSNEDNEGRDSHSRSSYSEKPVKCEQVSPVSSSSPCFDSESDSDCDSECDSDSESKQDSPKKSRSLSTCEDKNDLRNPDIKVLDPEKNCGNDEFPHHSPSVDLETVKELAHKIFRLMLRRINETKRLSSFQRVLFNLQKDLLREKDCKKKEQLENKIKDLEAEIKKLLELIGLISCKIKEYYNDFSDRVVRDNDHNKPWRAIVSLLYLCRKFIKNNPGFLAVLNEVLKQRQEAFRVYNSMVDEKQALLNAISTRKNVLAHLSNHLTNNGCFVSFPIDPDEKNLLCNLFWETVRIATILLNSDLFHGENLESINMHCVQKHLRYLKRKQRKLRRTARYLKEKMCEMNSRTGYPRRSRFLARYNKVSSDLARIARRINNTRRLPGLHDRYLDNIKQLSQYCNLYNLSILEVEKIIMACKPVVPVPVVPVPDLMYKTLKKEVELL